MTTVNGFNRDDLQGADGINSVILKRITYKYDRSM